MSRRSTRNQNRSKPHYNVDLLSFSDFIQYLYDTHSSQPTQQSNMSGKDSKMAKFSGLESDLPIEKWLNLVDILVDGLATEKEKIVKLMSNLSGIALEYFADHIAPIINTTNYKSSKKVVIKRFNVNLVPRNL